VDGRRFAGTDRVTVSVADVRPGNQRCCHAPAVPPGVSVAAVVPDSAADTVLLVPTKQVNSDTVVA
jgi:hypothetical protein